MGTSKKQRSPSPEWKNLEAQCLWPEQIAYEIIRPCQLEKQSITQRAVEVGLHPRTSARKLERFQQLGLPGLLPDSPDETVDRRRLPLEVREEILRLKAEYPAFIAHEIAVICDLRFQRASDPRVVQNVLNTYPLPSQSVGFLAMARKKIQNSGATLSFSCILKAGRSQALRDIWVSAPRPCSERCVVG